METPNHIQASSPFEPDGASLSIPAIPAVAGLAGATIAGQAMVTGGKPRLRDRRSVWGVVGTVAGGLLVVIGTVAPDMLRAQIGAVVDPWAQFTSARLDRLEKAAGLPPLQLRQAPAQQPAPAPAGVAGVGSQ